MQNKNTIWRIVVLSLLCYSLISLAAVRWQLWETERKTAQLIEERDTLIADKTELEQHISQGLNDEQIEQLARQRLGMVMPGDKIYYFTTDRED